MRPTRTNVDDLSLSTYLPSAAATSNPPQREVEHALLISLQRIVGLSSKRAYHCRWTNVHNGRDVSLEHPAGYGGEQVVRVTARASGRAAEIVAARRRSHRRDAGRSHTPANPTNSVLNPANPVYSAPRDLQRDRIRWQVLDFTGRSVQRTPFPCTTEGSR